MNNHPTVDFVNSTLITCYLTTCYSLVHSVDSRKDRKTSDKLGWDWETWTNNLHTSLANSVDSREDRRKDSKTSVTGWGWEAWTDTLHTRAFHTSAVTDEGILLVGC